MRLAACVLWALLLCSTHVAAALQATASEPSPQSQADQWGFQSLPDPEGSPAPAENGGDASSLRAIMSDRMADRTFKQNALVALSCTTVLVYLVAVALMYKLPSQMRGGQLVHLTSLALIVYGSLVLALVPTTHEGLTAPIGILGALAGYLFGHSSLSSDKDKEQDSKGGHG